MTLEGDQTRITKRTRLRRLVHGRHITFRHHLRTIRIQDFLFPYTKQIQRNTSLDASNTYRGLKEFIIICHTKSN